LKEPEPVILDPGKNMEPEVLTFFFPSAAKGFHQITMGQSESTPTGTPSIHWMPIMTQLWMKLN
jgi:hypothetical protein